MELEKRQITGQKKMLKHIRYADSAPGLRNYMTEIGTETQFWKEQGCNASLLSKSDEPINLFTVS